MTWLGMAIIGTKIIAAMLIMIGIRSLARSNPIQRGPRRPDAIIAGVSLWILGDLASVPQVQQVVASVPNWLWVGVFAAAVSFIAVLFATLAVFAHTGGSVGRTRTVLGSRASTHGLAAPGRERTNQSTGVAR